MQIPAVRRDNLKEALNSSELYLNTVKPVLNGNWIQHKPVFSGNVLQYTNDLEF